MLLRLSLFFTFFGVSLLFSQQIDPLDKAYILNDSLVVLGSDYILKSDLASPNDFGRSTPYNPTAKSLRTFSLLDFKGMRLLIDPSTSAIHKLERDSIIQWVPAESFPATGAAYLVRQDTLFKYGGKRGLMNIDYMSFLNEESLRWQAFPSFTSGYTPNGTFNNCYAENDQFTVFMRGARVNRRNLSDEYLDDHIVAYDWAKNEWFEWGHTRVNYKDFHSSISMGESLLFYNDKSMFLINPFKNSNSLYYKGLVHLNLHKSDLLDALYHENTFYAFYKEENGIQVKPIPREQFLAKTVAIDPFYDPPAKDTDLYYYLVGCILLSMVLYLPVKRKLFKEKIKLTPQGLKYAGVLHPIQKNQYKVLKVLLDAPTVPTAAIMEHIENPNISYSQNMKIKNQLIEQLNIILQTILNIPDALITDIKDPNDHRVTLYELKREYFKKR